MSKVPVASRKITTTIVNIGGKEQVIDFVNGIAMVEKEIRKYLVNRFPDQYFNPNAKGADIKFDNDFDAIKFYINKTKTVELAPRLCSLLKSEYETLQGDLLSGKYVVKTVEPNLKTPVVEDDDEDEDLVTGGDSINTSDDDEDSDVEDKEKKKKKKKKAKVEVTDSEDEDS